MFKTSLKNNLLLLVALALLVSANAAFAQSTNLGDQCINNKLVKGDGTATDTFCAPARCPGGVAQCPGTALCVGGVISGSNDASMNGKACTVPPDASGALLRDGIFGCSASKYSDLPNIGRLSAVGGVYVPVNDAAVTLNTGYLVYKECVLDGVVSAIKNDAVASLTAQAVKAIETSRNGSPGYYKNRDDLTPYRTAIVAQRLQEGLNGMCTPFQQTVRVAEARYYASTINDGTQMYACPFKGTESDIRSFLRGESFTFDNLFAVGQPAGNPYLVDLTTREIIANELTDFTEDMYRQIGWGNGFFPVLDNNPNPLAQRVLTPGIIIAQSLQQILGAGTEILVNANEINQVNGALQAGFTTSLLTGATNLLAATQSQNGQRSYLDRMATEASSQVRQAAVNTALGILGTWYQAESLYKKAKEAVATALSNAITTIKGYEAQCWEAIIPKVEQYASTQGATLRIATSTEFSTKIISDQIQPLATTTINDLRMSEAALALIQELITSVANSSSAANQQAALSRLDRLVAEKRIHSADDAQKATTDRDNVLGAITVLLDDTKKAWAESPDINIGWCNINNPDVITMWFNKWKQ